MAHRTIVLKGTPRYEEARASGIVKPGYLIKEVSGGTVTFHSTAAGKAARKFATEDALQGKTVADAYAVGDLVPHVDAKMGDEIAVVLAAGETVVEGQGLESAGNGKLRAVTSGEIIAYAREALDLSDTGAEDTLCAAEVA